MKGKRLNALKLDFTPPGGGLWGGNVLPAGLSRLKRFLSISVRGEDRGREQYPYHARKQVDRNGKQLEGKGREILQGRPENIGYRSPAGGEQAERLRIFENHAGLWGDKGFPQAGGGSFPPEVQNREAARLPPDAGGHDGGDGGKPAPGA